MRLVPFLAIALPLAAQTQQYAQLCSGCHGASAGGTERGPALANNRELRSRSVSQLQEIIRTGTQGGMPPFALPAAQLQSLARWVHNLNASAYDVKPEGNVAAGESFFYGKGQCGNCHMVSGRGGSNGPDLSSIGRGLTVQELEASLKDPVARAASRSSSGCPGWAWCPNDTWSVVNVHLRSGTTLRGFSRNQGKHDLQLQTLDGKFHLLRDGDYDRITRESEPFMPKLSATATEQRDLITYLARLGGVSSGPLKTAAAAASSQEIRPVRVPESTVTRSR